LLGLGHFYFALTVQSAATLRQIADSRVRSRTKAPKGCFPGAKLTKGRRAPEPNQDNSKSKIVVDKLIYLLLNTLICHLHMSYCSTQRLTDS
jgi:hypothetical protein